MRSPHIKLMLYMISMIVLPSLVWADSQSKLQEKSSVPTHADAAIIFAKYSGLFERYIDGDDSLSECVAFLNSHGVYFGLLDVLNGSEFTIGDCARVMGQIELVFSGDADYLAGKVILPKDIDSWFDFCIMHGVEYVNGYEALRSVLLGVPHLEH